MINCATIDSKTLFDGKNNPGMRLDAAYAIALARMVRGGEDPDPKKTVRSLLADKKSYSAWLKALQGMERIEDVETHIALALVGKRAWENKNPVRPNFGPEVQKGIRRMAKTICGQEARALKETIARDLTRIDRLEKIAEND